MTERFAKLNEQKIRELLDNATPKLYRVCLYNKTIIPFALVVYELIATSAVRASFSMSQSCTTRAHGITVKYLKSKVR